MPRGRGPSRAAGSPGALPRTVWRTYATRIPIRSVLPCVGVVCPVPLPVNGGKPLALFASIGCFHKRLNPEGVSLAWSPDLVPDVPEPHALSHVLRELLRELELHIPLGVHRAFVGLRFPG
jgi:hypothetical protein